MRLPGGQRSCQDREHAHLQRKRVGAGAFAAQREGLCSGPGLTGRRGGKPLTLQIVPSNELQELVEPNDRQ